MCQSRYIESVSIQGPNLNILQAVRYQSQSSPKYIFPIQSQIELKITNSVQCSDIQTGQYCK